MKIAISILVFLKVFIVHSSDFNPNSFEDHEKCSDFLKALIFFQEFEHQSKNLRKSYTICGKCICKKSYFQGNITDDETICPDKIEIKKFKLEGGYLSCVDGEYQHPRRAWRFMLPCRLFKS